MVRLEGYSIKERIGEGGFGDVFRAVQTELDRDVALKTLRKDLMGKPQYAADFTSQAKLAARLEHPNIVRVYDYGCRNNVCYVAMQYIKGHSLYDILMKRGPLAPSEVVHVGKQITDALEYAHRMDVIHADLNPGNIMVTPDGSVFVTDFGGFGGLRAGERVVGVPEYVSPEQARGGEVSVHSDIYSLGVIMYHMLCGRPPFSELEPFDTLNHHISTKVPPVKSPIYKVPDRLANLVARMLSKNPDDRPSTSEVCNDLRVMASSVKPPKRTKKRTVSRGRRIAAALIIPVAGACWVVGELIVRSVQAERALDAFAVKHASTLARDRAKIEESRRRETEYMRQMNIGHDSYVKEQYGVAEEAFRRASHLKPRSTDPRMYLAALYIEKAQYQKAIWHLQKILEISPGKLEAVNALTFVKQKVQAPTVEITGQ